jgi:hypothetical protein
LFDAPPRGTIFVQVVGFRVAFDAALVSAGRIPPSSMLRE